MQVVSSQGWTLTGCVCEKATWGVCRILLSPLSRPLSPKGVRCYIYRLREGRRGGSDKFRAGAKRKSQQNPLLPLPIELGDVWISVNVPLQRKVLAPEGQITPPLLLPYSRNKRRKKFCLSQSAHY